MQDLTRHPCDPLPKECYDQIGDPCPCNTAGDACLEEGDENNTIGILMDLKCIADNNLLSQNSPFTVDFSAVNSCNISQIDTTNVAANLKFMCIYNKLADSPSFKNLFIDAFGESENINVIFKVSDTISSNGRCVSKDMTINPTNGQIISANFDILISSSYMNSSSAISVAKTIMHESLHAFLIVKQYGCDQETPFEQLGDIEMSETLNEYYLECAPQQGQHEFMFNFMIPAMSEILADIRDDLVPENHQLSAEGQIFINEENPIIDYFGDYVLDTP